MDVDLSSSRQVPGPKEPYSASVGERYRRSEAEFEGQVRTAPQPPPPRAGNRRDPSYSSEVRRPPMADAPLDDFERGSGRTKWDTAGVPFDESLPHNARPRMLNERISGLPPPPLPPPPEGRSSRKQPQEIRQDNGYNGEPDAFEPRVSERIIMRQDNYALPAKTFEQRLDPIDRPLIQRGSLLSRISRGGNDPPPTLQSLRDRVQIGSKRGRDDMVRDHFTEGPFEADDGDPDSAAKRRKRRTRRRGGPP